MNIVVWILQTLMQSVCFLILIIGLIWLTFKTLDLVYYYHYKHFIRVKRKISDTTEKERSNSYPTKYPHGWYHLCYSWEVCNGKVIKKSVLGKNFVIFRAQTTDEIGILDAYCPHLGADLSTNGIVCNDLLQCSFHHWRFDIHGKCQSIPYSTNKRIPSNANAKCYHSIEYHDMICVYYGNQIPLYELPVQLDIISDLFEYRGMLDYGVIHTNLQEFSENAADFVHFGRIHSKMMFPFTQINLPFIHHWLKIHYTSKVLLGNQSKDLAAIKSRGYDKYIVGSGSTKTNPHFMYFSTDAYLQWKGKYMKNSDGFGSVTFCGPGGINIFRMNVPAYDKNANIVLFHTILPVDEMRLLVRFHWYAHKKLPSLLVWYVVGNWMSQFTTDVEIWESKMFQRKPCLVKGDGPILQVRGWFSQFCLDDDYKKYRRITINNSSNGKMCTKEKYFEMKGSELQW